MADPAAPNAMLEDDPNSNSDPRWGPNHKGAKELQGMYSRGKLKQYNLGNCVISSAVRLQMMTMNEDVVIQLKE
jgi:hypothetical protein